MMISRPLETRADMFFQQVINGKQTPAVGSDEYGDALSQFVKLTAEILDALYACKLRSAIENSPSFTAFLRYNESLSWLMANNVFMPNWRSAAEWLAGQSKELEAWESLRDALERYLTDTRGFKGTVYATLRIHLLRVPDFYFM